MEKKKLTDKQLELFRVRYQGGEPNPIGLLIDHIDAMEIEYQELVVASDNLVDEMKAESDTAKIGDDAIWSGPIDIAPEDHEFWHQGYEAARKRFEIDAYQAGAAAGEVIKERADRITELQNTIVNLRKELDFDHDQETERINQMWALVYPDDPTGWEYWAQVWRHVRDQRDELRQRIAVLEAEKANDPE